MTVVESAAKGFNLVIWEQNGILRKLLPSCDLKEE